MPHYDVRRASRQWFSASEATATWRFTNFVLYCIVLLYDFVFMQDSGPSHRAKATQNILRDNTLDFISSQEWTPHSPDLNPLDYSVWDILQELVYEGSVKHLRISKIFRMLSETNDVTMSMTRQSEKLYCWGKGVEQLWQRRMEDLFSTFSADQLTDMNYCDVLV